MIIIMQISSFFPLFLFAKFLWWQSLKNPHMTSCKRATFVGCAVLCGQNRGQYPHDYPLTLFRFPPAQSARPAALREPAVRSESTTLMSSSAPCSRHWLPFFVSERRACQRREEWQAKPGCAYGGPGLAPRTSTVAPRVFRRTALPCLSADIPKCVYKDVFWQIVMWELCLSACSSWKPTARVRLPWVCSSWGVRDVFSG